MQQVIGRVWVGRRASDSVGPFARPYTADDGSMDPAGAFSGEGGAAAPPPAATPHSAACGVKSRKYASPPPPPLPHPPPLPPPPLPPAALGRAAPPAALGRGTAAAHGRPALLLLLLLLLPHGQPRLALSRVATAVLLSPTPAWTRRDHSDPVAPARRFHRGCSI